MSLTTINEIRPTPTPVEISFVWSPEGPEGTVPAYLGSKTYNYKTAYIEEPITFTATAVVPKRRYGENVEINEYYWKFGDGGVGFGAKVTHTYRVIDPYTAVTLVVFDNRGLQWSCTQCINLVVPGEFSKLMIGIPAIAHP